MSDQVINYNDPAENRGMLVMRQISWAAVFAGVLVALAVEVLFLSFGLFIGFRIGPGGAGVWGTIWYFIGAFFSLMAGGWVAGRLSGNPAHGKVHGIVTWGLATVTTFAFLTALSWGVVTQSMGLVKTAALASASVPTANRMVPNTAPNEADRVQEESNSTPTQAQQQSQRLGTDLSNAALRLWIGCLIAACGAILGGAKGAPKTLPPSAA